MADGVTQFDQSGDTDKDNLINEKSWEVSTEKGNTEERNHGEGKVEVAKGSAAHQVEPSIKSRDSDADKDTQQQEKQGREGGVHQPDQTSPNEVAIPISAPSQSDAVTVANHNGDDSVEQTESGNDDDDVKVEDEENNDRESIFIDRFGNILDMEEKEKTKKNKANEQKRKEISRRDQQREMKWLDMIKNWTQFMENKSSKVKTRVRKGLPDSMRALMWPIFAQSHDIKKDNPGLFESLLEKETEFDDIICKDLARTFPNHVLFRASKEKGGQGSLKKVLHCYAVYDIEVGYCQGMAFIAGLLLMYLSEEDAFYMMVAILRGDRFNIHGLFSPGFPLLKEYFFQLRGLQKQLYPKLYNHFQEQSVVEEFYATQWFITLFLYSLPLELVLRIWDVFLFEGPKIIFRTAVYLWSRERKRLLKAEHLGATLTILKDSIEADGAFEDIDRVMSDIMKVKFPTAKLQDLELQYFKTRPTRARR